jgi:hypothetical protein
MARQMTSTCWLPSEGAGGAGQLFQLAGCADLCVGGVGSEVERVLQPLGAGLVWVGRALVLAAVDLGQPVSDHRLGRSLHRGEPFDVLMQGLRRERLRSTAIDLGKELHHGGEGRLLVGALAPVGEHSSRLVQVWRTHVWIVSPTAPHVYGGR